MSIVNNLIAFISGANPRFLAASDVQSRNRYGVYAFYIVLYTVIYCFAAYGLMHQLFDSSMLTSCVVATLIGLFVFFFNRTMIVGEKSVWINFCRFLLILAMNLVALMVIDSTLFHKDLALYEAQKTGNAVEDVIAKNQQAQALLQEQEALRKEVEKYEELMTQEISDKGGYGARARQFEKKAEQYRSTLNIKVGEYQELYRELEYKSEEANGGLLNKLSNMIEFTWQNKIAFAIWLLFFVLIFVLELMLLIIKGQAKPGLYDVLVERDQLKKTYQLVRS